MAKSSTDTKRVFDVSTKLVSRDNCSNCRGNTIAATIIMHRKIDVRENLSFSVYVVIGGVSLVTYFPGHMRNVGKLTVVFGIFMKGSHYYNAADVPAQVIV